MKVVITNTVVLNGGDAAILYAIRQILRNALGNSEIVVLDTHPAAAAKYHPDFTFQATLYDRLCTLFPGQWRRRLVASAMFAIAAAGRFFEPRWLYHLLPAQLRTGLRLYADADIVISTGGTYFTPNYQLIPKIFDLWIAAALKRPLVFFTQSMGRISERHHRILSSLFRRADLILLRDEQSMENLRNLQVSLRNVHVVEDAAFLFAAASSAGQRNDHPPKIAISLRDWRYFTDKENRDGMEDYLFSIAHLCEHLVHVHDAEIVFLSTCQGIQEYQYDDSAVALKVAERLPENFRVDNVRVDREFHTPDELVDLFSKCDAVIATRMHSAILALCSGTPVFPIAYEFKTTELFARLGLDRYGMDIEDIDGPRLVEAFDRFYENLQDIETSLPSKMEKARDSAASAGALLKSILGHQPVD